MLWDKVTRELPLHAAAEVGFMKALERMLKYYADVNVSTDGYSTALWHAARGCKPDAVRFLLNNKARVLPSKLLGSKSVETPFHAVMRWGDRAEVCDIVTLLLGADDGHECLERKWEWGETPLHLAVCNAQCFDILLQHGASVHAVTHGGKSLLHIIAQQGRHEILQQCIEKFSLEELEGGDCPITPLEIAENSGHEEVARLLKSYIRKAARSGSSNSGLLALVRNGLENLKRL